MDSHFMTLVFVSKFMLYILIVASLAYIFQGATKSDKSIINRGFRSLLASYFCLNLVSWASSGKLNEGLIYLSSIAGLSPEMLAIDLLISILLFWLILNYFTSPKLKE